MRAVLFATGDCFVESRLSEHLTWPLLPIVDRPIIQHAVESLASRGVAEFDIVVCHLAHEIEQALGDGNRWGVTIRYHLVRESDRPCRAFKAMLPLDESTKILLGHADRLPDFGALDPPHTGCVLFCHQDDGAPGRSAWTGWAWIGRDEINALDDQSDEASIERLLRDRHAVEVESPCVISARSFPDLLAANIAVLSHQGPELMLGGREIEPGIWLSRNVSLHPTARVVAPVFIGEDSRIGEGAQVGPNTVVSPGCIIDRRASISQSVVFPSSYVGQGIELNESIVVRNHLVDVRNGTEIWFDDDLLLSNASAPSISRGFTSLLSRFVALVGLILLSPVLLLTALGLKLFKGGHVFASTEAVRIPASDERQHWRSYRLWRFNAGTLAEDWGGLGDLLFRFFPGLWNVVRGEIAFVGVPARSAGVIEMLPSDWRHLYLKAKSGLISESTLASPAMFGPEDHHVSDAYYAVAGGLKHDLRLIRSYLGRALFSKVGRSNQGPPESHDTRTDRRNDSPTEALGQPTTRPEAKAEVPVFMGGTR